MKYNFKSLHRTNYKVIDGNLKEISFLMRSNIGRSRNLFYGHPVTFPIGGRKCLVEQFLPNESNHVFKRRTKVIKKNKDIHKK